MGYFQMNHRIQEKIMSEFFVWLWNKTVNYRKEVIAGFILLFVIFVEVLLVMALSPWGLAWPFIAVGAAILYVYDQTRKKVSSV
jgi:hypothetical protein